MTAPANFRSAILSAAWSAYKAAESKILGFGFYLRSAWFQFKHKTGVFAPAIAEPTYADRQAAARHIEALRDRYYGKNDFRALMNAVMAHPQTGKNDAFANELADKAYQLGKCSPKQAWWIAGSTYFTGFAS